MLQRFLRANAATFAPILLAQLWGGVQDHPEVVLLTPVLMALAKYLRVKFAGNKYVKWLPF